MKSLIDSLATYIEVLAHSAQMTNRAEDRASYARHLAAAATIFADLHSGRLSEASEIVRSERHDFGWGYLSGPEGAAADAAFHTFATLIDSNAT